MRVTVSMMMKLYRTGFQQFPIKNLSAPRVKLPNMVFGGMGRGYMAWGERKEDKDRGALTSVRGREQRATAIQSKRLLFFAKEKVPLAQEQ